MTLAELRDIRAFGLHNPVCVIPNGVTLADFSVSDQKNRTLFGAQSHQRVLLYLGRIHPIKGLQALVESWSVIRRREPKMAEPWILAMAGWGDATSGYETTLREQVTALDLDESVRFLGARFGADKLELLRNADAFVLASQSEGMPISVLEAWASGLPALITPQCHLAEGIRSDAAIGCESEAGSLAAGLQALFEMDDADRQLMGMNGRALVERAFNWDRSAELLNSVYQWLATDGSRPACVEVQAARRIGSILTATKSLP